MTRLITFIEVSCASKDQKEICYQFEDEPEVNSESDAPVERQTLPPFPVAAVPVVVAAPLLPTIAGPAASIEDAPICAVDILAVDRPQNLKKQLSESPTVQSRSRNSLSNGKSTLQRAEIMGNLQGEFSSAPDRVRELPLEEFGAALGSGHSGNLGKYLTSLMSHAIGGKRNAWWLQYFKCKNLISPRHGVWVPNVPTPCLYSLLPTHGAR